MGSPLQPRGYTSVVRVKSPGERALELVQMEFPNYHPLIALARMAHDSKVRDDPRIELEVHRTILPYVSPKLSVKEVEPVQEADRRIVVSLFEDRVLEDGTQVHAEVPCVVDVIDMVPLEED
jgi:hypothetical protein